jgi:L-malate glycosyltransferase
MSPESAPILYVHHGQNWIRGSERCLLDLIKHLDRSRFHAVVLTDSEALADVAVDLGVVVHRRLDLTGPDRFLPSWSLVRDARALVRAHRIRLVHANSLETVKWLLPVTRACGIPMLVHVHSPSTESERCYGWVHQVPLVVGVSATAVRGFLEDGLPRDRVRVVHNGVDPDRLQAGNATTLRAELGIAPDDIVLTAVGSLIERKGHDVLLAALAELRASSSRHRLLIIGTGPERAALDARARELGIADSVHFLGERPDVGAILRDATDIAVSAARAEAFPLNVLEAGFCARAVVVSNIPPHGEEVVPGETGLLVPAADAGAMARAIAALSEDPDLRRRYGEAASRLVRDQFLVTRYVALFERLYEELLDRFGGRWGWRADWVWPPVYTRWLVGLVRRSFAGLEGAAFVPADHPKHGR